MSLIKKMDDIAISALPLLESRSDQSLELHARIAEIFGGMDRLSAPRLFVAADALVLGAELHAGIALLTRFGHYASANALMRPLIETAVRSMWVIYQAPIEVVQRIAGNTYTIDLDKMLRQLAKRKDLPLISGLVKALSNAKSTLHSFTHVGYEQLRRREVGFDPNEVRMQLMVADLFAVICLDLAGVVYNQSEIKKTVLPQLVETIKELQLFEPSEKTLDHFGMPPMPSWKDVSDLIG